MGIKKVLITIFLWGILATACAPAPVFKCSDKIGCVDIAPGQLIQFGELFTLSGGSAPNGIEQARTVELAFSLLNNHLMGHPVAILSHDELCSTEGGANGVLPLVADPQLVAIFGTNCSSAAVAAGKIMSDKGLVMISGANTSPVLTAINGKAGPNWVPGYFRTAWNDAEMGKAAATFALQKQGKKKAAIIRADDAYSRGLTDTFKQSFLGLGGEIVNETTIDENETNQSAALKRVSLSQPDVLFFPVSHIETSILIIKEARNFKELKDTLLITGEAALSYVFIKEIQTDGVGVFMLGPAPVNNPESDKLRQQYQQKFGEYPPSFYYAFTYDAVNLVVKAIEKVSVVEKDGTLHIGREALREALYSTSHFNGISGSLSCDSFGDCGTTRLDIYRLDDPGGGIDTLRSNIIYQYSPQ